MRICQYILMHIHLCGIEIRPKILMTRFKRAFAFRHERHYLFNYKSNQCVNISAIVGSAHVGRAQVVLDFWHRRAPLSDS
jgi:hypothetical protein